MSNFDEERDNQAIVVKYKAVSEYTKADIIELHMIENSNKNKIHTGFSTWLDNKLNAEICRTKI